MQKDATVIKKISKVCVVGPECTGKTDMSAFLAQHYNTVWVEEYARAYLNRLGRAYDQDDLVKIAHGQIRMEDEWLTDAKDLLICDTNLVVIKIWSEVKYGECDETILRLMTERTYDLYLLTYIDIPWLADPLREHPDRREELYARYLTELKNQSTPFVEVKGEKAQRQKTAIDAINKLAGKE